LGDAQIQIGVRRGQSNVMCLTLHLEQLRPVKGSRIYSGSPGKLKFGTSECKTNLCKSQWREDRSVKSYDFIMEVARNLEQSYC